MRGHRRKPSSPPHAARRIWRRAQLSKRLALHVDDLTADGAVRILGRVNVDVEVAWRAPDLVEQRIRNIVAIIAVVVVGRIQSNHRRPVHTGAPAMDMRRGYRSDIADL